MAHDAELPRVLLDLMSGYRVTIVIYAAARLGIADLLSAGPMSSVDLARRTDTHEPSLRRLLRALVALGICTQLGESEFGLTPMGEYLADGAPQSMKPLAVFEGKLLWRAWESLLDSIRTGKTGAALAGFDDSFQQLAEVGAVAQTFNEAMVAFTRLVTPAVLDAYDFSGISKLMDVGGGYGELLSAILTAHPGMRGGIIDLAHCADGARKRLRDAGVSDRCEFIAGNFFESIPTGWDACILKSIIHDWNDERSQTILSNCRRALNERGKVLLVERIMPEALEPTAEHRMATLSDLNMLRGPGGCERTEHEFRALLHGSGLRMTRVLPAGPMHVIEAVCA